MIFCLLLMTLSAIAEEFVPVDLSATQGVEFFSEKNMMEAKGDVTIHRGTDILKGDLCKAYFTPKKELEHVEMLGNVTITSPQGQAIGDKGIYEISQDKVVLTGTSLKIESQGSVITAKDTFIYYPQARKAEAVGDVHILSKEKQELYADRILAIFEQMKEPVKETKPVNETLKLTQLVAIGNVKVITPERTATADEGEYFAEKDLIILKGHVHIIDETRRVQGDYAEISRGVSKMVGSPGSPVKALWTGKPMKTGSKF